MLHYWGMIVHVFMVACLFNGIAVLSQLRT